MKMFIKLLLILYLISISSYSSTSDFEDTLLTIETRKTAMQSVWYRIKKLSPYVELKVKIDYNKDLATNDAEEIITLLEKTKNLWPEKSNISSKGFTNATPAIWALPDYFDKLYLERLSFYLDVKIILFSIFIVL